jgi:hypothetical protein
MTEPTYITKVKPLTGADNYKSWCSQVIDILIEGDLDEYVVGDLCTVPMDPTLVADWKKKSKKALASIRLRVADGPKAFIKDCTVASDAWNILKGIYEPKGALARVQARRKLLHAQCEEGEDVIEHLTKMKEMYNDVLTVDDTFGQEEFCNCIVTSLPGSMDNFVGTIDEVTMRDPEKLIAKVLLHVQKIKAKPGAESETTALPITKSHNRDEDYKRKGCFNCGFTNHKINECKHKQSGRTFTEDEKRANYRKSLSFRKKGKSHKAHVAVNNKESEYELGFVAATQHTLHKKSWLLDTGCSAHIVNDKSLFDDYEATPGCSVSGVGSAIREGKGTVRITVTLGTNVETL